MVCLLLLISVLMGVLVTVLTQREGFSAIGFRIKCVPSLFFQFDVLSDLTLCYSFEYISCTNCE